MASPSVASIVVNRTSFGARAGDFARLESVGLESYVDEQLDPESIDDSQCDARLGQLGLESLSKDLATLWQDYHVNADMMGGWDWRIRPFRQVRDATWVRAVYSERQLFEVIVRFWHDHFNVDAVSHSEIASTWVHYDRDVIRANALGNFRQFLESVARSPAMLTYLNNQTNSAGGPNENYARELFELHTLGAMHYLSEFNSDPDAVPVDDDGRPVGYCDPDVYEAARAFTGWTYGNGWWNGTGQFPSTGEFIYWDPWHDRFQKYVLGTRVRNDQGPLVDGQQVLDLLARHPGTARHLATKLCRRFVADEPPADLVDRITAVWLDNVDAPDQIARVVRAILLAPELLESWGQKIKRPFDLFASFLRGTGATFTPNSNLHWRMWTIGQPLFEWPSPDGAPDIARPWLSSNVMLGRWNASNELLHDWFDVATFDFAGETAAGGAVSCVAIVDYWSNRLLDRTLESDAREALIAFLAQDGDRSSAPVPRRDAPDWGDPAGVRDRLTATVMLIVMSPDFQFR